MLQLRGISADIVQEEGSRILRSGLRYTFGTPALLDIQPRRNNGANTHAPRRPGSARTGQPGNIASDVYLRRGAQLDPIRAVPLVYLRRVRSGILGRCVQMYREGSAAHIKDVLDRVLVVRVHLVALVDELAELARRWGRRVELCNRTKGVPACEKKPRRTGSECRALKHAGGVGGVRESEGKPRFSVTKKEKRKKKEKRHASCANLISGSCMGDRRNWRLPEN